MSFQISKLRTWARAKVDSPLGAKFIAFILWLQDTYILASAWASYFWIRLIIFGCTVCNWLDNRRKTRSGYTRFLRAYYSGNDITASLRYFYLFDPIKSCASMYRWLAKFGYEGGFVDIIFIRNDTIYASTVDLDNDNEILTNQELPSGDVDLSSLVGKPLFKIQHIQEQPKCD